MSAKRLEQVALATKTAFVFPGQGSQKLNMARTLVERYYWARDLVQQADLWLIESGFEPSKNMMKSTSAVLSGCR